MKATSKDIKHQVIKFLNDDESARTVDKTLCTSIATVSGIGKEASVTIPKQVGGSIAKVSDRDKEYCISLLSKDQETNSAQEERAVQEGLIVTVSLPTIQTALKTPGGKQQKTHQTQVFLPTYKGQFGMVHKPSTSSNGGLAQINTV